MRFDALYNFLVIPDLRILERLRNEAPKRIETEISATVVATRLAGWIPLYHSGLPDLEINR